MIERRRHRQSILGKLRGVADELNIDSGSSVRLLALTLNWLVATAAVLSGPPRKKTLIGKTFVPNSRRI